MFTPIHYSKNNGLHRDRQMDGVKIGHEPMYPGQTTLQTFYKSSYANDRNMFEVNNPGMRKPLLPY